MKTMSRPSAFGRYGEDVEAELKTRIMGQTLPLYRLMAHQMGWLDDQGGTAEMEAGTRIRPTLCLLTCEALGGDPKKAMPAAAALELAHNFSLIHYHIQEGIPEWHHRPTVWWVWGPAQGINAGDGMHALARLSLLGQTGTGASPEQVLNTVTILDMACLRFCEGQYLDMAYQERADISQDAYFQVAEGKTAALMSCAAELGAIMAFVDGEAVLAMALYGRKLGIAYQIRDDILDLWGNGSDERPSARDILDKKRSLPIIYTLQNATGVEKRSLDDLYLKRMMEPEDVARVIDVLDRVGAKEFSQEKADILCQEALQALDGIDLSTQGRDELNDFARFLVTRDI